MPLRRLLLLLLVSAPAFAQDTPDVAPPAPAQLVEPLGSRFVWELRAPLGSGVRAAGLAIQPGAGGAWFMIDERGAVWLSEDDGGSWERVLSARDGDEAEELPDDEALLLEAEALRDEALEELEVEIEGPSTDLSGDAAGIDAPTVETEVSTDGGALDDAGAIAAELATGAAADATVLPAIWVDPTEPDRVFVGRADGVWRSDDAGRSWEQVSGSSSDEPRVTTFYRGADNALMAGTVDGVRFSLDQGYTWFDAEDATDGARVFAIVQEASAYWASTSRGLFRSENGLNWAAVRLDDSGPVRAVVPDPAWDAGFWVATGGALLRTDDGGRTFYAAGRQPLRGLRDMVQLAEPGHLLAISDDGVWESMDGGVMWTTADRQLGDPDVRALAFSDSGVVIATPRGVWRLVAPREATRAVGVRPDTLSLADSIDASTTRAGLNLDLVSLARIGVLAAFAPKLEVTFDYDDSAGRIASVSASNTVDSFDHDWSLTAKLCWGSCTATVVVDYDGVTDALETDEDLYVFDGEVYDEGEPIAAAANVAQRVRSYRRYLGEHVADAWLSRGRLVAESGAVRALPLREQVLHTLQIQELDARLDALTDGEFSRPSHRPEESR
ncbi:MAG: hypothetical protein Q8P18_11790 [Pseudomonadota bacterium]|nr:hypothetical protein [Pseudomonadota bacterium]